MKSVVLCLKVKDVLLGAFNFQQKVVSRGFPSP